MRGSFYGNRGVYEVYVRRVEVTGAGWALMLQLGRCGRHGGLSSSRGGVSRTGITMLMLEKRRFFRPSVALRRCDERWLVVQWRGSGSCKFCPTFLFLDVCWEY